MSTKDKLVGFRCTPSEAAMLKLLATLNGMTPSKLLRYWLRSAIRESLSAGKTNQTPQELALNRSPEPKAKGK